MAQHRTSKRRRTPIEAKIFYTIEDWEGAVELRELFTWAASDGGISGTVTPPGPEIPASVAETLVRMHGNGEIRFDAIGEDGFQVDRLRELAGRVTWNSKRRSYDVQDEAGELERVVVYATQKLRDGYREE